MAQLKPGGNVDTPLPKVGPSSHTLVRDDKVTRGRDGWLFLANDTNDVVSQFTGKLRLSPSQLREWGDLVAHRATSLAQCGIRYALMFAPDKLALYPEHAPAAVSLAEERPIHQLLDQLASQVPALPVVYPLDEMLAAKRKRPVASGIDSHWNDWGAFVAYQRVIEELEPLLPMRPLSADRLTFRRRKMAGDLSYKLDPPQEGHQLVAELDRSSRTVFHNGIRTAGRLTVTQCQQAPPSTCLLLGDSYSNFLERFMSETFGTFVFAHTPKLDRELVEHYAPDLVLSVMAERYLIVVPDDGAPPTFAELCRRQRGALAVPEMMPWDPPPVRAEEPEMVECMRLRLLEAHRPMDVALLTALAYGGLRPHEAMRLRWEDVRPRSLRVRGRGDNSVVRTVRLLRALADDLSAWRSAAGDPSDGLVFPAVAGRWIAWVKETFEPIAAVCKSSNRARDLRFTLLLLLARAGTGVDEIARQLGEAKEDLEIAFAVVIDDRVTLRREPASQQIRHARASAERVSPRRPPHARPAARPRSA
jgi:hypothetical protein